jgi:Zn-dependent peptidase ImmA (M78 family)
MTVQWERFAGSTDTFAFRLNFMPDPDDGVAVDPDEAVSWGSFQLWVDGKNLCAHSDQGETLQSAHWYTVPLLEWIIAHWNSFLHEERLPNRNSGATASAALARTIDAPPLPDEKQVADWEQEWFDWRERHAIRVARSGGMFPNVIFRRLRDLVEISWQDEALAGSTADFQFSAPWGVALVDPMLVANVLSEVTLAGVTHLRELRPESDRIDRLYRAAHALGRPDQREQRLELLAGLQIERVHQQPPSWSSAENAEGMWHTVVASLTASGNQPAAAAALEVEEAPLVLAGSCQATLLFGSVAPTVSLQDVRTLADLLIELYSPVVSITEEFAALRNDIAVARRSRTWKQGYELAESLSIDLGLSGGYVDVAAVVERLGIPVLPRSLEDSAVRGCSIAGPNHRPALVHNVSSRYKGEASYRFTLAHELCHLLYDGSYGQRLAIASGPWAPRAIEQRANAFAAMLLMPRTLVQRTIAEVPDPITDIAGARAVAQRLRVSVAATINHLYNLLLITEEERDALSYHAGPDANPPALS